MSARARLFAIAFAILLPLAGCLKKEDVEPAAVTPTLNESEVNTTLPNGAEFVAAEETNKTEEGVGGMSHMHDYWEGNEQITIYDRDVFVQPTPVFERGDNSRFFEAFVNLENISETDNRSALIYEGTGLVTFTITAGPTWATDYQMTFRTAGKDWSAWAPIKMGEPFAYEPEKTETDMPHSFRSLWNWKLQATGPLPVTGDALANDLVADTPAEGALPVERIHVTITVTKARNVDDWPGHPAFYDGVEERIVAENKPGNTNVQSAADVLIYGVEPDQVVPDKLISMGSKRLEVFVNVTNLNLPPGVPNGGFTLYWRTADTRPDDLGIFSIANETDDATFAYWNLTLEDAMLDSPYQPASRFGFKVLANPADDSVAACYRCVPYTIDYTMTVVARPE